MQPGNGVPSWSAIHRLEIAEEYPAAIDQLELRLASAPNEAEVVVRLGFNLWYAVVEQDRMHRELPTEAYARRFMQLYSDYEPQLANNADFCWAFGLGMQLFWFYFPTASEEQGNRLLDRARELDPFWATMGDPTRFHGRGIFQSYYQVG